MEAWRLLLLFGLTHAAAQTCQVGFERDQSGKCVDWNECVDDVPVCGNNSICMNNHGSYTCQCKKGFTHSSGAVNFTGQGVGRCLDDDECSTAPCGNRECMNTIGSYECKCPPGYVWNDNNCVGELISDKDVEECKPAGRCGNHTRCVNIDSKIYCECLPGYRDIKKQARFLEGECKDINECEEAGAKEEDICSKGTCRNTEGSFWCNCSEGYTTYGNKRAPCSKLDCDPFSANSVPTENAGGLTEILAMMRNSCAALSKPSAASEGKTDGDALLEKLLTATDNVLASGFAEKEENTYALLSVVENSIKLIAPQLRDTETAIETEKTDVKIAMYKGETPPTGSVQLSSENATLDTDWTTATGSGPYPGFALAALVSYKNLESSLNQSFDELPKDSDGVEPSFQIFSSVVSVVVSNPSPQNLSRPVIVTLRHLQTPDNSSNITFHCAFWTDEGAWSKQGCTEKMSNVTHTVCSCEHLSSFAVLMALYPLKDSMALLLITKIGLSVSLVCLALCILTFKFCRSIQGTRTTIHLHLCVCLFIADFIFLVGIAQTRPVGGCRLVAGLLHLFYLGVFFWMLLEGVQLYRMVVLVFNATMRPLYLYLTGYGAPLAIVILSAIIRPSDYGTDRHCWLSLKHGLIWSFYGPVCLIILLNVFFFIVTVWKLAQKFTSLNPDLSKLKKMKAFTVTAIAQMCILGLMWVFGALLFEENVVATYLFTLLNSLQGALVFILHCLLSKQVRDEYTHFLSCLCPPGKYSDFSTTNPSSQTQGSRSGQHTGESHI